MTTPEALECGCDLESCMFCGDDKPRSAALMQSPSINQRANVGERHMPPERVTSFRAREPEITQQSPSLPFRPKAIFSQRHRDALARLYASDKTAVSTRVPSSVYATYQDDAYNQPASAMDETDLVSQ